MHFYLRTFLMIPVLAVLSPFMAMAADDKMAAPQSTVILSVSGDLTTTNQGGRAEFDLDILKNLETTIIETSTIWTKGVQTFEGVALVDLVAYLGVSGDTLLATAINDYTVEIPVSDAVAGGPIIAYAVDGKPMSVRDKGPLWVIYPYDSNSDYRSEVIYSRSIWQLDRIEVVQ